MRIGHLTPSISRKGGGISITVRQLCKALQDADSTNDLQIFSIKDQFTTESLEDWQTLRTNIVDQQGPKFFGYARELKAQLAHSNLKILHQHGIWVYSSIAANAWKRKSKHGRKIISLHGMLDSWAIKHSSFKKKVAAAFYERRNLSSSDCLHALSLSEAEAIRAYGLDNPICVIPNGIDLTDSDRHEALPSIQSKPDQQKVLLFLGRIHPKKGIEDLVHAWALQVKQLRDWKLVVAGWSQGGEEERLKRIVEKVGLRQSIKFVGPVFGQEKAALFSSADAFILPSLSEGLPVAVLEAWSYRLPVLMTDECNIPEGFANQAAIPIQPIPHSIAAGLLRMSRMTDAELSETGQRGRNLVEEKFTWKNVAQQWLSIYEWLANNDATPTAIFRG